MFTQLVEIEPQEIKFIFEIRKHCSCSVRLLNKTSQYVAFKVKTTSPKKYSVRPNTGLIQPESTCDFIVTMQAQRAAPPGMICKDKFLIQSMVVPAGTTEEMITSSLFNKDDGKYVEENKLRVILVSPPHSPELSPKSELQNEAPTFAPHSPELSPMNGVHTEAPASEASVLENQIQLRVETVCLENEQVNEIVNSKVENGEQIMAAEASELKTVPDLEEPESFKDIEIMKSKIIGLELKLIEADVTISKMIEERKLTIQERDTLKRELVLLRSKKAVRKVRVGFPFLFVCMVALISAFLGYLLHW